VARPPVPEALERSRLIAILRHTRPDLTVRTVDALLSGGICAIEVTFNSRGVIEMLSTVKAEFGERVLLGAGTVLDIESADQALQAGAQFVVSPHTDPDLVRSLAERGVPTIPGAFTATEVLTAWRAGASIVKVFPMGSVGPAYIKDLRGPLGDIPLLPTGGVTETNAADFIRAGAWGLAVGGALVDPKLVEDERWDELARRARAFCEATRARSQP
jgi:2-dehydro-3-deoxyphosphogluconate aldolase/(4S)-4-hydroxy-2-oxoglutarate aldolase